MQRISLYTILLLLSMSCSLELPENTKSLKTCIKATGITATTQSTTTPTLNLSINGTTSDIAKVVWIVSQNSTEYYRTSSPFLTIPTPAVNGTLTITAQIVDKCGMSYSLTSSYVISNKTCTQATGITASVQRETPLYFNVGLTGTYSDIDKIVWVASQNGTEYYRSSQQVTLGISALTKNGTVTITAQIVDNCGKSYNLTLNIVISNGAILMLLPVEGGAFQMGNSTRGFTDAVPVHLVTLSSFNISKYEITQAQWKSAMGANPSSNFTNCDNCPVESVSWDEIQLFLTKLNLLTGKAFRLPTEAEWEYAARGGKLSKGYIYSGSNTIGDVAWYDANSVKTQPVGQKTANELGIYDMSGNVWEWCQDWYGSYSPNNQTNPIGADGGTQRRVLRGGSSATTPYNSEVPNRNAQLPANRYGDLGFRVVFSQ